MIVLGIIILLLGVYLVYALLHPENSKSSRRKIRCYKLP